MSNGKRNLLVVIGLVVVFAVIGILALRLREYWSPEKDLNVLLISLDATRADHFSFNGYPGKLTPNIDRLAETGVVFRRAYCFAGSTPPSMAAIFTSRLPYWPLEVPGAGPRWAPRHTYGLSRFFKSGQLREGFPDDLLRLPTIFRRHGYTTIGISNNPYLTRDFGFDRDFDFFEELSPQFKDPYKGAEDVAQKLRSYLGELGDEKFFAWVHFMDNHEPLLGYNPFRDQAKARGFRASHENKPVSEWTDLAKDSMKKFGAKAILNWEPTEENLLKALEEYRLGYAAQLTRVDDQIGLILDVLRREAILENTLIVIVSDHGDEFMEHGDYAHTGQLYEEIVRGIWIMYNPRLFANRLTIDVRVSLLDLAPTLVDLLRLPEDMASFDGVSRVPVLKGKSLSEKNFVFGVLDQRAYVIDGDYKLIVNNDYGKKDHGAARHPPQYPIELYNLKDDPGEQHNIAEGFPEVVDRLFIKLKRAYLKEEIHFWADQTQARELRKETVERLKALGYVE